ncbi:Prolactin-7A2 [Apodemus speciosus]|uniref:Prolactin-7A2 n=1 Tax=Apodemus speciosus TaxID=105296 RepID=A0ABQ0FFS3_APOSI
MTYIEEQVYHCLESTQKGALLLLVVSSLLLWENVASAPLSCNETDDDPLSVKGLFHNATRLTQSIRDLNMELRRAYTVNEVSEKLYHKYTLEFIEDMEFLVKALTCCHNYSIKSPENLDEAQQIPKWKIYGPTENVDYTIFSGLEDLKSSDEELSLFDAS